MLKLHKNKEITLLLESTWYWQVTNEVFPLLTRLPLLKGTSIIRKGKELILERITEERELNEGLLNKMEEKEGRSNEKDWLLEDTW